MNIESRSEELCGGHEKPGKIEREILKLWNLWDTATERYFLCVSQIKIKTKIYK